MDEQLTLDHLRANWNAQLEDIAVYFPDEKDIVTPLHDIDAQIVLCIAFKTAQQLIVSLEQRVKDLETVLNVINTPDTRPGPLEELGHVRGLDMLQWLYGNWQKDISIGVASEYAGIRFVLDIDMLPLECLVNRGYANNRERAFWITTKGRNYLKELKHDLRK